MGTSAALLELGDRYWALGLPAAAKSALQRALAITDDVTPAQMIEDDLVSNRDECLVRAFAASDSRLFTDAAHPLVRTGRSVPFLPGSGIEPQLWEDILPAAEQLTKEPNLLLGSGWSARVKNRGGFGWECEFSPRFSQLIP